jgi:hypothetical protein
VKIASLLIAMVLGLFLCESSLADDSPFKEDWVVHVKAEKLDRQFSYRGSNLNKIARLSVEYYKFVEPDNKTQYETMWFNDGKPIGLERKSDFNVPTGKAAKIEFENKKGTSSETEKAIADAILRLALDAYRKRVPVISYKVPEVSYQGVVDAMKNLKCVESQIGADEADTALMNFSIETENKDGPSTNLYYY